jgi:hypothetical protein
LFRIDDTGPAEKPYFTCESAANPYLTTVAAISKARRKRRANPPNEKPSVGTKNFLYDVNQITVALPKLLQ